MKHTYLELKFSFANFTSIMQIMHSLRKMEEQIAWKASYSHRNKYDMKRRV